jgi:hypothetical protein
MNTTISTDSIIQRNEGIVQAEIDGETVMMSVENGEYYGLDPVASRIWAIIETPLSVQALQEQLMNEYEVSEEQCQSDVQTFLAEMAENKVITLSA